MKEVSFGYFDENGEFVHVCFGQVTKEQEEKLFGKGEKR